MYEIFSVGISIKDIAECKKMICWTNWTTVWTYWKAF